MSLLRSINMSPNILCVDFDETYTAMPQEIIDTFITALKGAGWTVLLVTMRNSDEDGGRNDDIHESAELVVDQVIYCVEKLDLFGYQSQEILVPKYLAVKKAGFNPDNCVWLDDTPEALLGDWYKEHLHDRH